MNKKNDLFCSYVAVYCDGSRDEAARRIGKSAAMVGHIMNGIRGISPIVALRIDADTQGQISKSRLRPDLWGNDQVAA